MRQRYLVNFRWVPKLWLTLDFWLQSANKSVLLAPIEFELDNGNISEDIRKTLTAAVRISGLATPNRSPNSASRISALWR